LINGTKLIKITTNLEFKRWQEIFDDPTLKAAMVVRTAY